MKNISQAFVLVAFSSCCLLAADLAHSSADSRKSNLRSSRKSSISSRKFKQVTLAKTCYRQLSNLPGNSSAKTLISACDKVKVLPGCESIKGRPIYHYDKPGRKSGKRILAMSLIHGDEVPSGSVARSWMERLEGLSPRNAWRVIPVASPDGLKQGTRTNAAGVDLNRNFPSSDWDRDAMRKWIKLKKRDPRRYPGPRAASEPETQCFVNNFEDFKPDFIISIHTPLAVLDFDGPKMLFPKFKPLPWISLGTFPGSLGRYMWRDHKVPVLTIELKPDGGVTHLEQFDKLQDITGTVAIQSDKAIKQKKNKK